MGINSELSALKNSAVRQKIMESAFLVFAERGIEHVKMTDVAESTGIGVATVYRYFGTKSELVLAVGTWAWQQYITQIVSTYDSSSSSARQTFDFYLESFLDLYREHKDLLRFNQFFNSYVRGQKLSKASITTYTEMIEGLEARFHRMYLKAKEDGTMRTDVPEREIFSTTLHLMLAAVTRYAVGLVYEGGSDPMQELLLLKRMLMREYAPEE